jgi:hypothetical protein
MKLDLQAPIDSLRSIRTDLEVYFWEHPGKGEQGGSERYQISLWIRNLGERTAALEGVVMHLGGPAVLLGGVVPAERAALEGAADVLRRWVRFEDSFLDARRHVAAVLNAADTICLSAAGGRAENGVGRPG